MLVLLLHKLTKHNFRVHSSGKTSILSFNQIHPVVLKLNHANRQGQPYMNSFCAYSAKTYKNQLKMIQVVIHVHSTEVPFQIMWSISIMLCTKSIHVLFSRGHKTAGIVWKQRSCLEFDYESHTIRQYKSTVCFVTMAWQQLTVSSRNPPHIHLPWVSAS